MSKIIQLEAQNVKRLRAVTIRPDGSLVVIGGDNANGKTSVLDSIAMALGGANEIPTLPVRQGEDKAVVIVELDDGIIIKRTFTKAGGTSLKVTTKDGASYPSPQAILDKLTGKLTFDPLAFTRLDAKKQAEALRNLVGYDTAALDAQRKKLYEERTVQNRVAASAAAKVETMPFHADAPAEPVDTAAVMAELQAARDHAEEATELDRSIDAVNQEVIVVNEAMGVLTVEIEECERRLLELREQHEYNLTIVLPNLRKRAEIARDALANHGKPIAEGPIKEKLSTAACLNRQVSENAARAEALRAAQAEKDKGEALTSQIAEIDTQKAEALAKVTFPVPDLGFDDNGVTYRGVPFSQASAAEQLRVSVAIAAAFNPKLKVMLVKDGSLLDAKSLALLGELAVEHDLQVWVERVGKGAEVAVIIEDGAVEGGAA
tara:strand:- start:410 stop:1708 length:1299 start_codon:yes stop_codon:yes gene_type:complete